MDYITGAIDQIIYYSPDTGYTVCKFVTESRETLTIVGTFPPLKAGEVLKINGKWQINPRFGKQFKVENYLPLMPSSVKGIEKFLSSGLIKGIGPALARRITALFGDQTLDVVANKPKRLEEVEGIGTIKIREIKKSWVEHKHISDLIIFLQEHNISTTLATKIYNQYGNQSFHILKTNPYLACHDIWGIGFKTADQMALKLGISPDSEERIKAYVRYLLEKDNEQGHVFSIKEEMGKACSKDLDVPADKFEKAMNKLVHEKRVVLENTGKETAVYLPFYYNAQQEVVRSLHKLAAFPAAKPPFDMTEAIRLVEKDLSIEFSTAQKQAVKESLSKKILVITGGPGTGKTTIIRGIVDIFHRWGRQLHLAAPTGRAAKRLFEATRKEARTIHRTLGYNPKLGTFRKNESHPLAGDALIVDEFSMVDLPLMFHLLKAVPQWMRLILVGDKDQLPSVGPGNLLRDIIDSQRIDVVRLDEIFRQEQGSLIIQNAHRVNRGESLIYPDKGDKNADFYFIKQDDDKHAFETIMNLCSINIPQKLGLSPLSTQIQVISPMYRGLIGVDNLNVELQKRLNPSMEVLKLGSREIRLNDKVMQIKNNYDKDVFNGDIGIVADIDRRNYSVVVRFDGRAVTYTREELNELTLAYVVSVHKSQGSEYQAVVMPLLTQHFIMLQRNLFYTALTRAKKLSVIVGSYKALYIAINNNKPVKRNCRIKEKLMQITNSTAANIAGIPEEKNEKA